jgi:hypothetical protein
MRSGEGPPYRGGTRPQYAHPRMPTDLADYGNMTIDRNEDKRVKRPRDRWTLPLTEEDRQGGKHPSECCGRSIQGPDGHGVAGELEDHMVEINVAKRRLSERATAAILGGITLAPRSVDDALTALETVAERLHASDDVLAAFPDIYGIITRKVAEQVRSRSGMFLEPRWISRLAGRFCERYLETLRFWLERRPQDCAAWTSTYACSTMPVAAPAQHVLLGLSAHINFDLALGIYRTIIEFGHGSCPEMLARYKHDHDQVNSLLLASIPEAFELLATRHGCVVSAAIQRRMFSSASWITMQLLTRWRALVWTNVRALLAARTERERSAVITKMARRSALYGRLFMLPSELAAGPFRMFTRRSRGAKVIPLTRPSAINPLPLLCA